jgi:23S rRNA pseudouridine2605 synthase
VALWLPLLRATPYTVGVKERIQKVLANAGVASRRNVEEMIRQGRVAVNGKVPLELPVLVDPARDKITVDDEPVRVAPEGRDSAGPRLYILLNKPKGVYSTNVAQGAQTLAIDLLPPNLPGRVYPVGRLDAESKGLLLLTNDGELTNQLTHPRYGIAKTYRAVVDGRVDPAALKRLETGVWLADRHTGEGFKTGRSHIKVARRTNERSVLEITIREGRNRQVRRMLASLGHKVRDLTRVRMGPLTLEGLPLGHSRPLTGREIKALREMANRKAAATEPATPADGGEGDGERRPPRQHPRGGRARPAGRPSARPGTFRRK